ncbi:hypothetical protein EYF80_033016 [Liparis tanakae]|uniref:Uncharacterized protein n=1 Tax=Liparis tanakae TaxID=230148 RepID=A0A4Z2GSW5_9TELE|nr:hypothetical protein EYF80_033016 [Liparis tanakae]
MSLFVEDPLILHAPRGRSETRRSRSPTEKPWTDGELSSDTPAAADGRGGSECFPPGAVSSRRRESMWIIGAESRHVEPRGGAACSNAV